VRIELTNRGFADLGLTTWLPRRAVHRNTHNRPDGSTLKRKARADAGLQKLERETGFEPATSTLARSHSTTELLPPILSFYSTCAFHFNSLHPHRHPLIVRLLFGICDDTPVGQESLKELGLGASCLMTVVHVVHRHVDVRLTKHALHYQRTKIQELRAEGLTLRDIATRCRVSKTTVIRALT
jgi:hypothetical protein